MQRPTLALVVFVSLLGLAGSAKADTIDFRFVSTPNINGTYVDASGTLTGTVYNSPSSPPTDLNALLVGGGTITVVSNIPASPFEGNGVFGIPELNGSSDISFSNSGLQFNNSPNGIIVSNNANEPCNVCFLMPGNPAVGGDFTFTINASGVNGTANNSQIVAGEDGNGPYNYVTDGTLTIDGQVGAYDLTPEPASLLLLGSGVALLVFMVYRKSLTSEPLG